MGGISEECAHLHGQVVLGCIRKQAEQAKRSGPGNSTPQSPLFLFLPRVLPEFPSEMNHDLGVTRGSKPLPLHAASGHDFITVKTARRVWTAFPILSLSMERLSSSLKCIS